MKLHALAFLAGLVSALGFQPLGWWPLTILAFAMLLWLIERAPSLRTALARGWWFGLGQFVLGLNWIATAFTFQAAMPAWLGWIAVVLLSLYLAIFPAVTAGLAWRWGRSRPLAFTLIFAAAWIVTEWLRATLFTGFAWNPAGVVLLDRSIAPLAALVGTYGLSAMVILFAGLVRIASLGPDRRPAIALAGLVLAAQVAALAAAPEPAGGTGAPVRVVQPNIGQHLKWSPDFAEQNMARLERLSRSSGEPRLLIWPEAAVTEALQDERRQLDYQLHTLATRRRVAQAIPPGGLLLTGGITFLSEDGVTADRATNSVFAMTSDGEILARYDKAHLVPYGEYLPMRPILSAIGLSRLAPGDLDFQPGPGPRTLDVAGIGRVGFQLCYEIIFSGQVVDPERRPAFIFNPSNDAWFGAWGPPQHLAQARLRALEEGIPIVRATPTGISAIIDAQGDLIHSIPLGIAGTIDADLPLPAPPTLFARYGNALPFAFAFLLAAAGVFALRGREAARGSPSGIAKPAKAR
ncbi:apolipoprotein N-acyltransferase [Sphingosinicella sp. CPCC 101087]|uniref:apolipoprotein N-acyltransferase n=1 Tax=Sphingosinicella sp. CPCC 101087 TaxID=2497754 RepID=UPI00101DB14A|nr:apolipoprotein N-acyltransferase [Sphingosinicella sp. CPCC 101087]